MAATDPVVTVDDLRDFMSGIELEGFQREAAEDVIAGLLGQISGYLGRPVVVRERTEYASRGWLKGTPVVSIKTIDGIDYNLTSPGAMTGGRLGYAATVTYTGGLLADEDARDLIRIMVLRAAADEMTNRHDDTVSVKDLTVRDDGDNAPAERKQTRGLDSKSLAMLNRWRRSAAFQREAAR